MYTITIRAAPMASGANAPAGPESAITDRQMNVPTNSVSNFAASLMVDPNVARDAAPRGGFPGLPGLVRTHVVVAVKPGEADGRLPYPCRDHVVRLERAPYTPGARRGRSPGPRDRLRHAHQ